MNTPDVPNEPAARWVPIDSLRAWEKNPRHNEPAVARIIERQPFQTVGLVTDVEPFLRDLSDYIDKLTPGAGK